MVWANIEDPDQFLEKQSDQGLQYLQYYLHLLDALGCVRTSNFSLPNLACQRKICLCELKHVTKSKWQISTLKVLTDHFSNSLSEKTTNDTPMSFQEYFLAVATRKLQNFFTNHSCRTKVFLCFTSCALCALTISHFKVDILQDSEDPHKKNRYYCATYNQAMQYTILKNGCLN